MLLCLSALAAIFLAVMVFFWKRVTAEHSAGVVLVRRCPQIQVFVICCKDPKKCKKCKKGGQPCKNSSTCGRDPVEFPKGHLEGFETAQQAALRELREETGYSGVDLGTCIHTSHYQVRSRTGRNLDGSRMKVDKTVDYFIGTPSSKWAQTHQKEETTHWCDWITEEDLRTKFVVSHSMLTKVFNKAFEEGATRLAEEK